MSLITPGMSLHFAHAALTLALTAASSGHPSSLMVTAKYLNLLLVPRLL